MRTLLGALSIGAAAICSASGFVANQGQWDDRALFKSSSAGVDVWVTPTGATLDFATVENETRTGQVVRLSFVGASGGTPVGIDRLPGHFNWIRGKDRSGWARHVPHFAEAWVRDVLPGVDARWYRDQNRPRYDLVLDPGTDPRSIRMKVEGADRIWVDMDGELVLDTRFGPTRINDLYVYQNVHGKRVGIEAGFKLNPDGTVGYDLAPHDPSLPLVIDPVIFATFVGSSLRETPRFRHQSGIDAGLHTYVAGRTAGATFPTTAGAYQGPVDDPLATTVTKLSPDGSSLVWSTYFHMPQTVAGTPIIAVDAAGFVTLAMTSDTTQLPVSANAAFPDPPGGTGIVLVRFTQDGSDLAWATYYGSADDPADSDDQTVDAIYVDDQGRTIIGGNADEDPVPTTAGAFNSGGEEYDVYVARFSADGTQLEAATQMGSQIAAELRHLDVAANGDVLMSGFVDTKAGVHPGDPTYPTTQDAFQRFSPFGEGDGFITRLREDMTGLVFSTYVGGLEVQAVDAVREGPLGIYFSMPNSLPDAGAAYPPGASTWKSFGVLSADGSTLLHHALIAGRHFTFDDQGRPVLLVREGSPRLQTFLRTFTPDLTEMVDSRRVPNALWLTADPSGRYVALGGVNEEEQLTTPGAFQEVTQGDRDYFLSLVRVSIDAMPGALFEDQDGMPAVWRIDGMAGQGIQRLPHFKGWQLLPGDHDGEPGAMLAFDPRNGNVMTVQLADGEEEIRRLFSTVPNGRFLLADFDNDGDDDVLVQQTTTWQTLIWIMENGQRVATVPLGVRDRWRPHIGDLESRSDNDLVWQLPDGHIVGWEIYQGKTVTDRDVISYQPNTNLAVGDVQGSGNAEIVIENPATGTYQLLSMSGTFVLDAASLGRFAGRRIVGLEDMDGDGQKEILLLETATSRLHVWDIADDKIVASGSPGLVGDWQFDFLDVDGDGKTDVLLYEPTIGFAKAWIMDGTRLAESRALGYLPKNLTLIGAGRF